jgi:hypothetical protein
MDLEHCLHWLHLEPTLNSTTLAILGAHSPTVLHWLHLEPTHLQYYNGYTWSPFTVHWLHLEPTHHASEAEGDIEWHCCGPGGGVGGVGGVGGGAGVGALSAASAAANPGAAAVLQLL